MRNIFTEFKNLFENFNTIFSNLKQQIFNIEMEQHTLKNVNNCLITNIYSYSDTSGGQSSNLYLNVVHFFNTSVN
jgi:hypothetical protein